VILLADAGDTFKDAVANGPLLLALPVAMLAGLVSFLSPCVLPLVPGYLSYITGLTGADLAAEEDADADDPPRRRRGRIALGGLLFVLGFSAVFVSEGALFGSIGVDLVNNSALTRWVGVITIILGLAFSGLLGRIPFLNREFRLHRLPAMGLAGAPVVGFLFGLGWSPCVGPTLGVVLTLALTTSSALRGAILSLAYCLGLGLPFILSGLAFRRAMSTFSVVKRHYRVVMAVGGGMLVLIGILQVTGVWNRIVLELQTQIQDFTPAV
jgi:cytochrome c-type biogenesis protein